jgi:hypothetical protein
LCELIKGKPKEKMAFISPIPKTIRLPLTPYTDDGIFDIEKRESVKTLLTLWKGMMNHQHGQKKWHFQMQ